MEQSKGVPPGELLATTTKGLLNKRADAQRTGWLYPVLLHIVKYSTIVSNDADDAASNYYETSGSNHKPVGGPIDGPHKRN